MPGGRGGSLSEGTRAAAYRAHGRSRSRRRLISFGTAGLVGLVVSLIVPRWLTGATHFAASYDAGALTLLAFFWLGGMSGDPEATRRKAATVDPGRNWILLLVMFAVATGLVAAIAIIGHGPKVHTALEKWEAYGFGLTAIVLGWFLVHTIYTFRYAHLYWRDDDADGPGGIRFPETAEPSYYDFAYLAFTIGTSFAVSDPQITSMEIRREVMWHSIISFAYNSVIIGMVINLFAGIFGASSGGGGGGGGGS